MSVDEVLAFLEKIKDEAEASTVMDPRVGTYVNSKIVV